MFAVQVEEIGAAWVKYPIQGSVLTQEDQRLCTRRLAKGGILRKILVADDKATGREIVRTVLERAGYEVFEAGDGFDALSTADRVMPDLIILDLHMPAMDGFGVIKELRSDPRFATLPVMALTASAMEGDRQRAILAGFTSYLCKPVSLQSLRNEVERLLR